MSTPSTAEARPSREAWAGESPLREAARERLLDATARCIVRDGLPATAIASVAAEAGVSRPTVYRYFRDRHALVLEALLREGRALAAEVAAHVEPCDDAATAAVEALLFVLERVPREPLLAEIWTSTLLDASMLGEFTKPASVAIARSALGRVELLAGWSDAEADEAVELALRFLFTLLIAPGPSRSEDELRAFVRRRLVPALGLNP